MNVVGVLGESNLLKWRIKQRLTECKGAEVEEYSSLDDVVGCAQQGALSVLVHKVKHFDGSHIATLKRLSAQLPKLAILMAADEIPGNLRAEFADLELSRVFLFDINFEFGDLIDIIEKLGRGEEQVFRRFRRYYIEEPVSISSEGGIAAIGTLVNISAGGACVKLDGCPIRPGEMISIKMPASHKGGSTLQGRVTWIQKEFNLFGVLFDRAIPEIDSLYEHTS